MYLILSNSSDEILILKGKLGPFHVEKKNVFSILDSKGEAQTWQANTWFLVGLIIGR